MRIFVDTNVLFDIFAQREPFRESSYKIMVMQLFGDAELWAAPQSYLDIFYILSKSCPSADLQKSLAASLARVNLCAIGHADMAQALQAAWDDVEDAVIGVCCKSVGADYLLTRDKKQPGFDTLGIPVLAPEEFFELLEREHGISYQDIEV